MVLLSVYMQPLIVFNWKMNLPCCDVEKWCRSINEMRYENCIVCPPYTHLDQVRKYGLEVGAQDSHYTTSGACTGGINAALLKDIGCKYVILGHAEVVSRYSEVRDSTVKKIDAVLSAEMIPIVCIPSDKQCQSHDDILNICKSLLYDSRCIAAYEPIYAIGTGILPSLLEIQDVGQLIRENFGVPVMYGGSVNEENARSILKIGMDGLLIGGASLEVDSSIKIMEFATEIAQVDVTL